MDDNDDAISPQINYILKVYVFREKENNNIIKNLNIIHHSGRDDSDGTLNVLHTTLHLNNMCVLFFLTKVKAVAPASAAKSPGHSSSHATSSTSKKHPENIVGVHASRHSATVETASSTSLLDLLQI